MMSMMTMVVMIKNMYKRNNKRINYNISTLHHHSSKSFFFLFRLSTILFIHMLIVIILIKIGFL